MECCFCKKTYKNEYILANHQKTTKKCLDIQVNTMETKVVHACTFCKKELSTKNRLVTHLLICKKKSNEDAVTLLRDDLEEKDKKIKELETVLKIPINVFNNPSEIKEYHFGTDLVVPIRNDGMINATALCKAGNKSIAHYLENKNTKDYLKALESDIGIPISQNPPIGIPISQNPPIGIPIGQNSDMGFPIGGLIQNLPGSHSGTWVHRKVGYHLAQWISPSFAVRVSSILDELFITGTITLGKEKSSNEIEILYQQQVHELQNQLTFQKEEYQKLLVKHVSSLKNHRYVKFKETGPCFYIIEQGVTCHCIHNQFHYKFGVAGKVPEGDTIDDRLKSHRTLWPQLKICYLLFVNEVDVIERSIKRMYEKNINPNGHEIIEGVSVDQLVTSINEIIHVLRISEYQVVSEDKMKEYNDYVVTTVKVE